MLVRVQRVQHVQYRKVSTPSSGMSGDRRVHFLASDLSRGTRPGMRDAIGREPLARDPAVPDLAHFVEAHGSRSDTSVISKHFQASPN